MEAPYVYHLNVACILLRMHACCVCMQQYACVCLECASLCCCRTCTLLFVTCRQCPLRHRLPHRHRVPLRRHGPVPPVPLLRHRRRPLRHRRSTEPVAACICLYVGQAAALVRAQQLGAASRARLFVLGIGNQKKLSGGAHRELSRISLYQNQQFKSSSTSERRF